MRPFLHAVLVACLIGATLAMPATAQILAPSVFDRVEGQPGRVVLLDASGSMAETDYQDRPKDRMSRARILFNDYSNALLDRADPLPTAVYAFGNRLSWRDNHGPYKVSTDYPPDGPMCADIEQLSGFQRVDATAVEAMQDRVAGINAAGMTPLHVALNHALGSLDPDFGGEIVVISDLDVLNCLPPGQTLCEAIAPQLARFKNVTFSVTVTVFETPNANVKNALKECLSVRSHLYPPNMSDSEDLVADALAMDAVTFVPAYTVEPIDPAPINAAQIALTIRAQSGGAPIYEGPPSRIQLPPGSYELSTVIGGRTTAETFSVSGDVTLPIKIAPPRIRIDLVQAGQQVQGAAALTVTRLGSSAPLAAPAQIRSGDVLAFGTGDYQLQASLPDGTSAIAYLTTSLGNDDIAVLEFPSSPASGLRTVDVSIRMHEPTLAAAVRAAGLPADFSPSLSIDGYGPLPPAGGSIQLAPATYRVVVGGAADTLDLVVTPAPASAGPLRILVEVVPGRFAARLGPVGRTMRLIDAATGTRIGEFHDAVAEHSLPDGAYALELLDEAGNAMDRREFRAQPGSVAIIDF